MASFPADGAGQWGKHASPLERESEMSEVEGGQKHPREEKPGIKTLPQGR